MANVPQNSMFKQTLSGNQEAPLILGCNERQVQRYNVIVDKAIIHEQLLCNVEIMCPAGPNFCRQETPATRGPNLIELPNQSAKLVLRSPWWQTLRCLGTLNLSDRWNKSWNKENVVFFLQIHFTWYWNPLEWSQSQQSWIFSLCCPPHTHPWHATKVPRNTLLQNLRPCFNVGLQDQGLRKHALVELLLKNRLANTRP